MPSENEAVIVRVVGEQFAWNMQYPGPDGKFGRTDIKQVTADNPLGLDRTDAAAKDDITTINQLNLPVDRPALVHLSSKDVIHSFGLYEMRVKQDAVPGLTFRSGSCPRSRPRRCGRGSASPTSSTKSRAPSCAASVTSACAASSPMQSDAEFQKWLDDQAKELATTAN